MEIDNLSIAFNVIVINHPFHISHVMWLGSKTWRKLRPNEVQNMNIEKHQHERYKFIHLMIL